MRYTAIFADTQGPGGAVCDESGHLYYMFDADRPLLAEDEAKQIAGVIQVIQDGLSGQPELVDVLVGGFMPRSHYKDPFDQQKRENRAQRVQLYTYRRP